MRKLFFCLLLFVCVYVVSGCGGIQNGTPGGNKVYTSIYPVYYFTSRIAEGGIEVEEIIPPSADPHNWEPSPKQVAAIESSPLFIYNGAGLEPWADKVSLLVEGNSGAVLNLSTCFSEALLPGGEHDEYHSSENHGKEDPINYDPHFWLDPVMAKEMAESIKDYLIKADPDNKELYQNNFHALASDLEKLHAEYRRTLEQCRKKEFVVTHQAFGYLAKRYGLTQIAAMGISPDSEPSPARLAGLSRLLKEHDISYVFSEPFTGSRVAQTLASETGARVLELNPIGGLTKDQTEAGDDYLTLMRDNLEQLKVALEYGE